MSHPPCDGASGQWLPADTPCYIYPVSAGPGAGGMDFCVSGFPRSPITQGKIKTGTCKVLLGSLGSCAPFTCGVSGTHPLI